MQSDDALWFCSLSADRDADLDLERLLARGECDLEVLPEDLDLDRRGDRDDLDRDRWLLWFRVLSLLNMTTDLDRVRLVLLADRDLCRDRDLDRDRRRSCDRDLERLLRREECDLDLVLLPCREADLERLRRLGDRDLDLRCDRLTDGDLDLCLPDL